MRAQIKELRLKVEDSKPIVKNEVSSSQTEGFESDNNSIAVQKLLLQSDQKKTKDIYNQTSATNEYFSEYPCFYCGFAIKSRSCLTEHSALCEELAFRDRVNILGTSESENRMDVIQSCLLQLQERSNRILQCNICQETFKFNTLFEMHKMFSHPE